MVLHAASGTNGTASSTGAAGTAYYKCRILTGALLVWQCETIHLWLTMI